MKSGKMLILSLLVLASLPSAFAAPCNGESGYEYINYKHRNPTKGGFVSYNAFVDDTDDVYIAPTATICGSSHVSDHARIYGTALIDGATVTGYAEVFGQARVSDGAEISDNAKISENAQVSGSVRVYGRTTIAGNSKISNYSQDYFAQVYDSARISGSAVITENAQVFGNARIFGNAAISGDASVSGNAVVSGYTKLSSGSMTSGNKNDPDYVGIEKAKKEAQAKEAQRLAEIERARKAKESRDGKINRYNEIVKEMLDGNYLGATSENTIDLSVMCTLKSEYRMKTAASEFMRAYDETYSLKVDLREDVLFTAGTRGVGGVNCVQVDLRALNGTSSNSERSYIDNNYSTTGYAMGVSCMSAWYRSSEDSKGIAGLLTEMSNICKSL